MLKQQQQLSKAKSSAYKHFVQEQLPIQQQKFPQRSQDEILKLINLLWKQKDSQPIKTYYQSNGYVQINDQERVSVPQPPPPVLIIFQKNMRQLLELTHPEYNGEQVDRTIKFEWTANTIQREKAAQDFKQLRQEFEKDKKEFIIQYGFWPKYKKIQKNGLKDLDQLQQSSEMGNPLAQLLIKKIKLEEQ